MECEQQIRSINHIMNVAEINDVKSVQEQVRLDEEKETYAIIQEAWKSIMDMRNAQKEPEKVNLVDETKMAGKLTLDRGSDQITLQSQEIINKNEE